MPRQPDGDTGKTPADQHARRRDVAAGHPSEEHGARRGCGREHTLGIERAVGVDVPGPEHGPVDEARDCAVRRERRMRRAGRRHARQQRPVRDQHRGDERRDAAGGKAAERERGQQVAEGDALKDAKDAQVARVEDSGLRTGGDRVEEQAEDVTVEDLHASACPERRRYSAGVEGSSVENL